MRGLIALPYKIRTWGCRLTPAPSRRRRTYSPTHNLPRPSRSFPTTTCSRAAPHFPKRNPHHGPGRKKPRAGPPKNLILPPGQRPGRCPRLNLAPAKPQAGTHTLPNPSPSQGIAPVPHITLDLSSSSNSRHPTAWFRPVVVRIRPLATPQRSTIWFNTTHLVQPYGYSSLAWFKVDHGLYLRHITDNWSIKFIFPRYCCSDFLRINFLMHLLFYSDSFISRDCGLLFNISEFFIGQM